MQLTLKEARARKGWTLDMLAEKTGIHKSNLSRLERGETQPMHDTAIKIEVAFGRGITVVYGARKVAA